MSRHSRTESRYRSLKTPHDILRAEAHDSEAPPPSFRGTRMRANLLPENEPEQATHAFTPGTPKVRTHDIN